MDELQRRPSEFAEILGGDNPPLIVGGQAVNIWAELYASRIDPLTNFEPFVSRDADIFGTRALAEELARKAGWNCKFVETKESVIVAILSAHAAVASVAEAACTALRNMTCLREGQLAAVDAGAPATIVGVMRSHSGVPAIIEVGCWTLRNIALLPAGQVAVDATRWQFPPT